MSRIYWVLGRTAYMTGPIGLAERMISGGMLWMEYVTETPGVFEGTGWLLGTSLGVQRIPPRLRWEPEGRSLTAGMNE